MYLLAINCGSSSIKGKLYKIQDSLQPAASLSVSNITSDEPIKIKVQWQVDGHDNVDERGQHGTEVDYQSLVPLLLDRLGKVDIKYIAHRVVHGGTHKKGIQITKDHDEGLAEMEKLSQFAPLHNHHAVLAVRSCLDALPNHTSLLLFDTLFHQTIPPETYTYALPPPESSTLPLRKYGFHGLSYASIVSLLSRHLGKPDNQINIVVAHLGSGASCCCIKNGQSIDTSMGLTPLEGLIGGTRSGTIDPTTIFHLINDPTQMIDNVSKAEIVLNKQSGLQALAGTTNFGTITTRNDPQANLAYAIYLDRLLAYVSQYVFKLLAEVPSFDGIVFSGGIGEKSSVLRADVLAKFKWLGVEVNDERNEGGGSGQIREITMQESKIKGWVVETDEEGQCAKMAREQLGF